MSKRNDNIAEHLERVKIKRPSDVIIEQISGLISEGVLKPGQKLPPERVLSERFGVGRPQVREALHKLEVYGIVHTLPQSGTFIEKVGVQTLERLLRNVLGMEELTSRMLMEVRGVLESFAAELAAERASSEQVAEIRKTCDQQAAEIEAKEDPMEADFLFHIRVADATNNVLLRTLISLMRPDVMRFSEQHRTIEHGRPRQALDEHQRILKAIENRSPVAAVKAMRYHMDMSSEQFHDQ